MVHIVETFAGEISDEIFITGKTGRNHIKLAGTSKASVQQSLAAIMAFSRATIFGIFYDTNINQWVPTHRKHHQFHLIFFVKFIQICSLLKRGSMFILSEEQFKNLLMAGGFNAEFLSIHNNEITILDIGAGDGEVTMRLAKSIIHMNYNIFLKVFATEYSWTMRDRLQEKQFTYVYIVITIGHAISIRILFEFFIFCSVIERLEEVTNIDLISCLNVLDRCADPHQILADIHRALSPNGRAVIALVLPYSHYVETSKFAFYV